MVKWRSDIFGKHQDAVPKRPPSSGPAGRFLGLLVPSLVHSVFGESIQGMAEAARAAGYGLAVEITNSDVNEESRAVQALLAQGTAGLLLSLGDANANGLLTTLDRDRVPYCLVYHQISHLPRSSVSIDYEQATRDIMETLILYGHRTIGMVVPSLCASDRSVRRLEGYRDALKRHAMASGPLVSLDPDVMSPERITASLAEAMEEHPRPTALLCCSDLLAMACIARLPDLGYGVPKDISVVGFDGLALGRMMVPGLAGITQPHREIGRAAATHLIERIAGKAPPAHIVLDHQIHRDATLARWAAGSLAAPVT